MSMGITQALKMQRGSVREIAKLPQQQIMAMAQRQEIPAPMVPIILNEKARMAKEAQQMQAMQQMQAQGQPPTVTEQNMQAIDQAEMQDAMQQEAMRRRMMSGLGSMPMRDDMFRGASGGIVAFEDGGPVERYASRGFVAPKGLGPDLDEYGVPSSFLDSLEETAVGDVVEPPVQVGEKGTDFESMVARTMKQLPESEEEKAYAEYMRNQRQRTAGQLEQDRALNLINLGAQIMGGTSPYAFTNIGQGLAAGLPAFQKTAQAQREAERENLKGLADMSRRNRDIALQTGAKLYEVEQESLGRELTRDAAVRRAEIAAARGRDTFGDRQVMRRADAYALNEYKKPFEELPAKIQKMILGKVSTDYDIDQQRAALAGVGQRETAADMEDRFRRAEAVRKNYDAAADSVDKRFAKMADPDALKYRELMDSGKEEEARAFRQRLIDRDFESRQRGSATPSATPSAKPTASPSAKAAPATAAIPDKAIEHLKANNNQSMRALFDAKYGKGAAARALGG
jgi:hypothetical protein